MDGDVGAPIVVDLLMIDDRGRVMTEESEAGLRKLDLILFFDPTFFPFISPVASSFLPLLWKKKNVV
jgi:hypothetical protein